MPGNPTSKALAAAEYVLLMVFIYMCELVLDSPTGGMCGWYLFSELYISDCLDSLTVIKHAMMACVSPAGFMSLPPLVFTILTPLVDQGPRGFEQLK